MRFYMAHSAVAFLLLGGLLQGGQVDACNDQESKLRSNTSYTPGVICNEVPCPPTSVKVIEHLCAPELLHNCFGTPSEPVRIEIGYLCLSGDCNQYTMTDYGPGTDHTYCGP